MKVETLDDVLKWTRTIHANLADCLTHDARDIERHGNGQANAERERAGMLLNYLAQHERELSRTFALIRQDTAASVLNTWCYEYFSQYPTQHDEQFPIDFSHMDTSQMLTAVLAWHEKLVALYRDLQSRAEVPATQEFLANLLDLEEHEAIRMARDAGRMDDL